MTKYQKIATPTRTAAIMKEFDIKMKKSLGQNFIIEPNILAKMMAAGQISKETTVIEIGPGIGALTEFLALQAKEVYAFEIDQRFITILETTLKDYDNVKVIHQDILQVDFNLSIYQPLQQAQDLVVCANLPYYITTPIIMHLMNSNLPFSRLVMMMQKEVAERMTAKVGTKAYNSLSIAIANQMEAEIAFIVPKTVFIPRPNVDSAVLVLDRKDQPIVPEDARRAFEDFVKSAFAQRRKTLWNNLKASLCHGEFDQDQLLQVFDRAEIASSQRAESLSIEDFVILFEAYQQVS